MGRLGCRTSATAGCSLSRRASSAALLCARSTRSASVRRPRRASHTSNGPAIDPCSVRYACSRACRSSSSASAAPSTTSRVPGEVLGHGVHDDVRAVLERALHQGRRERVVDADERTHRVRRLDERREVGDLEHGVGRRLDPEQRRGPRLAQGGDHRGGVVDVDQRHVDAEALLQVLRVAEGHLVGVPRQDQPAAGGHQRERRRDGRHARAEHQGRVRGALERAERLLERVPRRGVHAAVQRLAGRRARPARRRSRRARRAGSRARPGCARAGRRRRRASRGRGRRSRSEVTRRTLPVGRPSDAAVG